MSEILKTPELSENIQNATTPAQQEGLEANAALHPSDPKYDAQQGPLALFALYGPQLFAHVDKLSSRQMRRLLKALVTWPLEDVEINKKNPIELSAYNIANEMITSRFLLTMVNAHEENERRKAADEEYKKTLADGVTAKSIIDQAQKDAAKAVPLSVDEVVNQTNTQEKVNG